VLRRRRPPDPIDQVQPAQLAARWSAPVRAALAARQRFLDATATARAGPLRDRFGELRGSIDDGVIATWEAAQRAQALDRAATELDIGRITNEHKAAQRSLTGGADDPGLRSRAAALADRHATAQRLLNAVDDAAVELAGLEARLETLAVRAIELVLVGPAPATSSTSELDSVLDELRAVRGALDELR
jgi:hypothetical protein